MDSRNANLNPGIGSEAAKCCDFRRLYASTPANLDSTVGNYMRQIEYHYGQPHAITYNLSVERELPFNMLLTVAYTGFRGLSLS